MGPLENLIKNYEPSWETYIYAHSSGSPSQILGYESPAMTSQDYQSSPNFLVLYSKNFVM